MASFISVTMHSDVVAVVRSAIADIDKAHNVATAAVEAAPDPVTAFARGQRTRRPYAGPRCIDDKLKEQLSGLVWDARKMSLAGWLIRSGSPSERAEQQAKDAKADKDSPA